MPAFDGRELSSDPRSIEKSVFLAGENHGTDRTILIAVGTRPEAVKIAPVVHAFRDGGWPNVQVLATAQHRHMLDQILGFFGIEADDDLDLMRPDQSLPDLTSRMIPAIDAVLQRRRPHLVMAQGDTTTVFVTALCCFYRRIPFGHIEAGLRTGEKYSPFPEEMNRTLAGHLGELHFAPTQRARDNLLHEGIRDDRIVVTGNTVIDALLWAAQQDLPPVFDDSNGRRLILVTAHRRENFGRPLEEICDALRELVERHDVDVLYPVHPNPNVESVVRGRLADHPRIRLTGPLDYPHFVSAMKSAHLILTDSGGVQEEAPTFGKPVLVLRDQTERPEGVAAGTACVVGPHRERIVSRASELLTDRAAYEAMARAASPYGDGRASQRIVEAVGEFLSR